MSEIDFETGELIYQVEITHRTPASEGVWLRAMNAVDEDDALAKATQTFTNDGMNPVLIDSITITELKMLED